MKISDGWIFVMILIVAAVGTVFLAAHLSKPKTIDYADRQMKRDEHCRVILRCMEHDTLVDCHYAAPSAWNYVFKIDECI